MKILEGDEEKLAPSGSWAPAEPLYLTTSVCHEALEILEKPQEF